MKIKKVHLTYFLISILIAKLFHPEPEDNFAVIYNRKMVVGRKGIYKFMLVKKIRV